MANLANLPTELLDAVLADLGRKDLHALSLACKRLNFACEELLYHTIDWAWDPDGKSVPSPRVFLCSILRHPRRASLVVNASFRAVHWSRVSLRSDCGYDPADTSILSAEEIGLVHTLIDDLQLPDASRWKEEFANGAASVPIALILTRVSNIQSLTLGREFQWDCRDGSTRRFHDNPKPDLLGIMLQHAVLAPPSIPINRFSKLKSVQRVGESDEWAATWESFLLFLHAPCLETMKVDALWSGGIAAPVPHRDQKTAIQRELRPPWPSAAPRASRLTSLSMENCLVADRAWEPLLSAMPNLKALDFSYSRGYRALRDGHKSYHHFKGGFVKDGLAACAASLERLRFSYRIYLHREKPIPGHTLSPYFPDPIGSLKDFSALRELDLALPMLLGWKPADALGLADVLPPGLEELVINDDLWYEFNNSNEYYWDGPTTNAFLERFLGRWREVTPRLRRITLTINDMEDKFPSLEVLRFKALCIGAGIACVVDKVEPADDDEMTGFLLVD